MVPCLFLLAHSELLERDINCERSVAIIDDLQNSSYEALPSDQKQVYHQLGPLYQKIYLCALNDEERHRVVVYVRRGVSCFEAINIILRAEERKFQGKPNTEENKPTRPSDRGANSRAGCQEIY